MDGFAVKKWPRKAAIQILRIKSGRVAPGALACSAFLLGQFGGLLLSIHYS